MEELTDPERQEMYLTNGIIALGRIRAKTLTEIAEQQETVDDLEHDIKTADNRLQNAKAAKLRLEDKVRTIDGILRNIGMVRGSDS